jgi:hypothetical protein
MYIFLEDKGTFFSQASENQQFACIFVVSNFGYETAAEIVDLDHLK